MSPEMRDHDTAYVRTVREANSLLRELRQPYATRKACECEHADHFDGGPSHEYGKEARTSPVKTDYGTFHVCKECADGHWKEVVL